MIFFRSILAGFRVGTAVNCQSLQCYPGDILGESRRIKLRHGPTVSEIEDSNRIHDHSKIWGNLIWTHARFWSSWNLQDSLPLSLSLCQKKSKQESSGHFGNFFSAFARSLVPSFFWRGSAPRGGGKGPFCQSFCQWRDMGKWPKRNGYIIYVVFHPTKIRGPIASLITGGPPCTKGFNVRFV